MSGRDGVMAPMGSLSRAWGVLTAKITPEGVGGFASELTVWQLIPPQAILNPTALAANF